MYYKIVAKFINSWYRTTPYPFYNPITNDQGKLLYCLAPMQGNHKNPISPDPAPIENLFKAKRREALREDFDKVVFFNNRESYRRWQAINKIKEGPYWYKEIPFRLSLNWNYQFYNYIVYECQKKYYLLTKFQSNEKEILGLQPICQENSPFQRYQYTNIIENHWSDSTYYQIFRKISGGSAAPDKVFCFLHKEFFNNFLEPILYEFIRT